MSVGNVSCVWFLNNANECVRSGDPSSGVLSTGLVQAGAAVGIAPSTYDIYRYAKHVRQNKYYTEKPG